MGSGYFCHLLRNREIMRRKRVRKPYIRPLLFDRDVWQDLRLISSKEAYTLRLPVTDKEKRKRQMLSHSVIPKKSSLGAKAGKKYRREHNRSSKEQQEAIRILNEMQKQLRPEDLIRRIT